MLQFVFLDYVTYLVREGADDLDRPGWEVAQALDGVNDYTVGVYGHNVVFGGLAAEVRLDHAVKELAARLDLGQLYVIVLLRIEDLGDAVQRWSSTKLAVMTQTQGEEVDLEVGLAWQVERVNAVEVEGGCSLVWAALRHVQAVQVLHPQVGLVLLCHCQEGDGHELLACVVALRDLVELEADDVAGVSWQLKALQVLKPRRTQGSEVVVLVIL